MNATASQPARGAPPAPDDADEPPPDAEAEASACGLDALPDTDDEPGLVEEPAAAARPPASPIDEARLAQWIARIVQRDESALAALYDATLSRTYGLVLRIVRRAALADEVVEDTYFQVWRQAPRFDPARGKALTWVRAMGRSRAIDALRREARFRHDSLDDEAAAEPSDAQPPVDELLEVARRHADLHQALLALQAQPRQLVALAFFRGLSHEEIASHTALPLGTVKSRINLALGAMRRLLDEK